MDGTRVIHDFDTMEPKIVSVQRNILKPMGDWVENYPTGKPKIKGKFSENGKQGEWVFYNPDREIVRIKNYENDRVVKEEYVDLLLYNSMEVIAKTIQGTWALMTYMDSFIPHRPEHSNSCAFKDHGVFKGIIKSSADVTQEGSSQEGSWTLVGDNTLEIIIGEERTLMKLNYVSDRRVNFKYRAKRD